MIWERNGDAFYATVVDLSDTVQFSLIAEPLPDGTWDWVVFRKGESAEQAATGVANTAREAMRAAEQAAQ